MKVYEYQFIDTTRECVKKKNSIIFINANEKEERYCIHAYNGEESLFKL